MCEKHYDCVCLYPRVVLVVRVLIDKSSYNLLAHGG